jgi:peptidoglycan/LPS O-acetylase OafA/YrhL
MERLTHGMSAADFMIVRIIRLYPLYIMGIGISISYYIFADLIGNPVSIKSLLANAAPAVIFLPTPRPLVLNGDHLYPLNFPAWSLFFELTINGVFALVVERLSSSVLIGILIFGAGLLIITAIHYHGLDVGVGWSTAAGGFGRVTYAFFAGVAVHAAWKHNLFAWIRLPAWAAVLVMLAVFALRPTHASGYDLAVALLVFPVLVLAAARVEPGRWTLPVHAALGQASYAIYTLHVPMLLWIHALVQRGTGREFKALPLWAAMVFTGCVTIVALIANRFYDPLARRLLARLAGPRQAAKPSLI